MTPAEIAALNNNEVRANEMQEKSGNSFVRALTAPFKAIGRLFGKGKKGENKLQRLTEKDLKHFETTPADPVRTAKFQKSMSTETDHLAQARAYLVSDQVNEAISELTTASYANPNSAETHNLLGLTYERKGLRNRALNSFARAVEVAQNNPEYLNNFGYLLFKNGDHENAAKFLQRAARLAPNNPLIWNNLGLAQCELGRFNEAYKSFATAQGEFKGHLNLATRLQNVGKANEAIKHLEKALILQPNSVEALEPLVSLYENTGRHNQAQNVRKSLLTLRGVAPTAGQ
jgi:Flp pilus assembly protein TadD